MFMGVLGSVTPISPWDMLRTALHLHLFGFSVNVKGHMCSVQFDAYFVEGCE
jgi:hypothetical protein